MILATLLMTTLRIASADVSDATMWNDCLQSFKNSKRSIFDVSYNENDSKNHILFRNGKSFGQEALHIFHKGQFWNVPLEITNDFYKERKFIAVLGDDKFCLTENFRWIRADQMSLVPFNAKNCTATETLDFKPETSETKPAAGEVLTKKLQREVEMAEWCINGDDSVCNAEAKQDEFKRMSSWKTAACEKIADDNLKKILTVRSTALVAYTANLVSSQKLAPAVNSTGASPKNTNK